MTTEQIPQDQNLLTAAEESAAADQADNKQPDGSTADSDASKNSGDSGADGNAGELASHKRDLEAANATITELREQAAQVNLQAQIDRYKVANDAELAADQQAIEDGNLTAADATRKQKDREAKLSENIREAARKADEAMQLESRTLDNAILGRYGAAEKLAREHGLPVDDLMLDTSLQTEDQMRAKAIELAAEAKEKSRVGTEKFDAGQRGATSIDVNDMSAAEKVTYALSKQ